MLGRLIGVGRIALGLTILASPRLAARLFALPPREINASARLTSRLTGNRELVLGAALLLAPAEQLPAWLRASAAIDAADAVVSLWGLRDGLPARAALQSAAGGALYTALELTALKRAAKPHPLPPGPEGRGDSTGSRGWGGVVTTLDRCCRRR